MKNPHYLNISVRVSGLKVNAQGLCKKVQTKRLVFDKHQSLKPYTTCFVFLVLMKKNTKITVAPTIPTMLEIVVPNRKPSGACNI